MYIEGQLAGWLKELSPFDMSILHWCGTKHGNADGLSRKPDEEIFCDCYKAGVELTSLPYSGCKFCTRAHKQWSRFEEDVDDVVPLGVKSVSYTKLDSEPWLQEDPCLEKLMNWILMTLLLLRKKFPCVVHL